MRRRLDGACASTADAERLITSNTSIMCGRRVIRGTRVPVEVTWEDVEDGLRVGEILHSCGTLHRADVVAVLEQGSRRAAARQRDRRRAPTDLPRWRLWAACDPMERAVLL